MPRIIGRKFCAISVLICLVLQCASPASSAGNATEPSTTSTTDSPIYAISSVPVNGPKSAIAVLSDYVQDILPASVQPRFFSVLSSLFQVFRYLFRHIYEGVHHYRPEIRLGRCMVKIARKQYPELRQRLSYDNMWKFAVRMFEDVSTYASDVLTENQSEEWLRRERIATKVMQLTEEEPLSRQSDDPLPLHPHMLMIGASARPAANRRMDGRPLRRRVAYMAPRHFRRQRRAADASSPIMRIAAKPIVADEAANEEDEFSDLNEKSWEELLDFDSVIYDSLGIDRQMAKEWTPINCAKEYTVQFVKRFIIDFLSGEILAK